MQTKPNKICIDLIFWYKISIDLIFWYKISIDLIFWFNKSIDLIFWHKISIDLIFWFNISIDLIFWHKISIDLIFWYKILFAVLKYVAHRLWIKNIKTLYVFFHWISYFLFYFFLAEAPSYPKKPFKCQCGRCRLRDHLPPQNTEKPQERWKRDLHGTVLLGEKNTVLRGPEYSGTVKLHIMFLWLSENCDEIEMWKHKKCQLGGKLIFLK